MKNLVYYIPTSANVIAILISLYFIISDNINFSTADNSSLTLITILFMAYVIFTWWLKSKGKLSIASLMAWLPAVPLIGYGLMILLFIILKPDMR